LSEEWAFIEFISPLDVIYQAIFYGICNERILNIFPANSIPSLKANKLSKFAINFKEFSLLGFWRLIGIIRRTSWCLILL